jgi:hypothetical protein
VIRALAAAALVAAACAVGAQAAERAPFALLGDVPYSQSNANLLDVMIDEINAANPAFVVHLGDITSRDCGDAWFEARRKQFARFTTPFVLVPGDNEWADCHLDGKDPMERLAKIRQLFHAETVKLPGFTRQWDAYPEHVRWTHSRALFVGLNVPGSNNNLGRTKEMDAEHAARMKAVLAWLDEAVALARSSKEIDTLVVLMQANPNFEGKGRSASRPDGYAALRERLEKVSSTLGKPVVVAHGDTHIYKFDRPSKNAPGLVRIEVDGWPWMGWVKVETTPDPAKPVVVRRLLNQ